MKRLVPFLLLWVGLVMLPLSALAQATASGSVAGTVLDPSGAVVPSAVVTISSEAIGLKRSMTTSDNGQFRFDLLGAGMYRLTVTHEGFATINQEIELLVGQTATSNVTLRPGAAEQTVEVGATTSLVDVTKTGVSVEITPTEVAEMPVIGRDVANLAYLAPGVKFADSYDPTKSRYAILSVNGSGGRNVNVTVNGVDNKDNTVGGPVMQLPLEAVEEYKISTQRFSAENGRSEGAAINLITKRGTNTFHGSLFGFFRDAALNTDEKIPDGKGGQTKLHPDYSHQQFGGSIGGRLIRDKAFAFFAFEREREHQALATQPRSLSELTLAAGAGLAAQPVASIPRPFFETRLNGRLDYAFSDRESAYVSISTQGNNSLNDQSDGTGDLTNGNFTTNHLQIANFTLNSIFSNTAVNQATVGWQYWNNLIASNISVPLVTFPDASFGTNTNVPQQSYQRKWQFKDDFSKSFGKHTLKTGVDYIWNPVEGGFFEFSSTLEIDFADDPSVILNDPVNYPKKFATPGAVVSMSQANGNPYFNVATKQLGLYFQDDWKVSQRLLLNLGIRWDRDYNMVGASDVQKSRTYQELVAINSPLSNPYVQSVPHDDKADFSPRVGFAYDVTGVGHHVIRGGYGLYYGNIFQNIPLFMEQMSNPTVFQTVLSLTSPGDTVPGTGKTLGQWQYGVDPLPTIPPPSTQLASGSVGRLIDPHYRNPVTEEFNVGYTWAISPSTGFETEYTHVLGLHENKTINIDQRIPLNGKCCTAPLNAAFAAANQPVLASVRDEQSIGRSRYDGVNFIIHSRVQNRFQLSANYTLSWARGYNDGGGSFRNYPRLAFAPFAPYEFGYSPNDERHHITISGVGFLPWGFEVSPIMQYGSARPYNLTNSANTLNTGGGTAIAVVVPISNPTAYQTYAGSSNRAAAQNCFYGLNGSPVSCTIAKYDPQRGDPFFQLDMRLAKNFKFGERARLQLVAQAFNLSNRANYGNDFSGNIASASFGKPVGFVAPGSTVIPRSTWGEFGARFTF